MSYKPCTRILMLNSEEEIFWGQVLLWDVVGDGTLPPGVRDVVEGMTLSRVRGWQGVVMGSDP